MVATLSSYMQKPTDNEPELPVTSGFVARKKSRVGVKRIYVPRVVDPTEEYNRRQQFYSHHADHRARTNPQMQMQMQQTSGVASTFGEDDVVFVESIENEHRPRAVTGWTFETPKLPTGAGRYETKAEYKPKVMANENPYHCGPNLANPSHIAPLISRPMEEHLFQTGGSVPYLPPSTAPPDDLINAHGYDPRMNAATEYLKVLQRHVSSLNVQRGLNPGALRIGNYSTLLSNMHEISQQQQHLALLMQMQASIAAAASSAHQGLIGSSLESAPQEWQSPAPSVSLFPEDSSAMQWQYSGQVQPTSSGSSTLKQNPVEKRMMSEVAEAPILPRISEGVQYSNSSSAKSPALPDQLHVLDVPAYLKDTRPHYTDEERKAVLLLARGLENVETSKYS